MARIFPFRMAEAVLCAVCRVGAGLRPRPVFRGRGIRRGRPMCRPGHAPSRHPPTGGHTGPPLQREGEVPATTQASGAQRSVCAADGRKGLESRQRSSPKCPATSDNPSVTAAPCQLPLHKGALGTGDADCHVAPLLAMTVLILCHSEEAQRADVGIRPFYDGRGFGPPYLGHGLRRPNFVPKFGASVKSSCPTGDCFLVEREPFGRVRGLSFSLFPGRLGGSGAWGTGCFFGGCRRSGLRRTPPPGGRHRR